MKLNKSQTVQPRFKMLAKILSFVHFTLTRNDKSWQFSEI